MINNLECANFVMLHLMFRNLTNMSICVEADQNYVIFANKILLCGVKLNLIVFKYIRLRVPCKQLYRCITHGRWIIRRRAKIKTWEFLKGLYCLEKIKRQIKEFRCI